MSGQHARLSPSAAHRWMLCAGSVALAAAESGESDSSEYAAQGTALHKWASECLQFGFEPHDLIGHRLAVDGYSFEFSEELADLMQPGLDRLREFSGVMTIERRVSLDPWLPGQFGTLDVGIINNAKREAVIFDWKFGAGVPVSPLENPQLMLYALGFWHEFVVPGWDYNFRLVIEQPRIPGGGGEWLATHDELMAFGERVREAGKRTEDPAAPLVAGETQCRFCPARLSCPALARFNLDLFGLKFDDLDADGTPELMGLSPERRAYVVRHADLFRKWIDEQHAIVLTDALNGRPTPGLKVVAGRKPARSWSDDVSAETFLLSRLSHDQAFNVVLKSPTQVEKLLGKDDWSEAEGLIAQGDPKPTLVPESDRRPALIPYAMKFDDLTKQRSPEND